MEAPSKVVRAPKRFFALGFADADARVAALMARRPFTATDEYVSNSVILRALDLMTCRLRDWCLASTTARSHRIWVDEWQRHELAERHQAIGVLVVSAVSF